MSKLEELLKEALGEDADISTILEAANNEASEKTRGLTAKRDQLLQQINKLKKNQVPDELDLEGYKNYLEEKEQMEADKARLEEEKLAASGEWKKLKDSMVKRHADELNSLKATLEGKLGTLQSALDKELIENVVIKAIDKEKGNAALLMPHIAPHLKTVQLEDGSFQTQVYDGDTQRLNTQTGEPFSVAELVAEFKANDLYAGAFPMQNSGSGVPAGKASGSYRGQMNPFKAETKNVTEQARLRKENPVLAEQMAKAAGVG